MDVTFAPFAIAHADELVEMWRASFEAAVGVREPHTLEQQRSYLLNEVLPACRVLVAIAREHVVGFIAATPERIDQLYVHGDYQGTGIGSTLLQWAKEHSQGHLYLFTLERNLRARMFYEARGFKVADRGFAQQWQLPDIRYEWTGT